jgi:hypothetical protein
MFNIAPDDILNKLPADELDQELEKFLATITELLSDKRLRRVVIMTIKGILAGQTPVITGIAQSVSRLDTDVWPASKRIYRFCDNRRFSHRTLRKGLYRQGQRIVHCEQPAYLVAAIDPVNFEKAYTKQLEGVSTVYKSTPPDLSGRARLTPGFPAITATVVNTRVPATTYANWFSYKTPDFISENREIHRAIRTTRWLYPAYEIRFVGDAGLDDRKIFGWIEKYAGRFIIRASHLERLVEVYNERLDRWETEHLRDLVSTVPFTAAYQVAFTHAGKTRMATIQMGWLKLRLPETHQGLWALVAEDSSQGRTLVLLTNIPINVIRQAKQVYDDWRLRTRIEHGYRFDQEQGLDVEDIRVHTLERMRRIFILVLAAAQFIFYLMDAWPPRAILWLRELGGKLGIVSDRDGPYILLKGLAAVLQTVATVTYLALKPFPHEDFSYG